eukprot:CAMPEP_0174905128 /NCGR_PEP_ID=MMETSP0167-20121228/51779_1 /TAXON_ID=38298 /ORGANISM="Rhodella maculata, Strain CCMP736" /LENGTH=84 /DNA_ID=CAMNT_0016147987 /DNA_START=8 /DNA_END=259 /DNA_ORIENTATION=+
MTVLVARRRVTSIGPGYVAGRSPAGVSASPRPGRRPLVVAIKYICMAGTLALLAVITYLALFTSSRDQKLLLSDASEMLHTATD